MKSGIAVLLLLVGGAHADPLELRTDQVGNDYRNTGVVRLRDPDSNEILLELPFATGGFGRGSAPFGLYKIEDFQGDGVDEDPLHIGPRYVLIGTGGNESGEVYDNRLGKMRTEIELHRLHTVYGSGTLGCFGVLANANTWNFFLAELGRSLRKGPVTFAFGPGPGLRPSVPMSEHLVENRHYHTHGKTHEKRNRLSHFKHRAAPVHRHRHRGRSR